jgi:hypothetical protein
MRYSSSDLGVIGTTLWNFTNDGDTGTGALSSGSRVYRIQKYNDSNTSYPIFFVSNIAKPEEIEQSIRNFNIAIFFSKFLNQTQFEFLGRPYNIP